MRAIKSFTLGFGMVAIPVKLYGATDDKREGLLNNICGECKTKLKQPKHCPTCGTYGDAVAVSKGYELEKGKFIEITPEELENIKLESTHNIQVEAFVKPELLEDPRWFKDSYFLSPDEPGAKAFVLFTKAMENVGVVGISKFAIRDKEMLCAIRPFNGVILLQTLHWADEFRDYSEIQVFASVTPQEMEMASKLISVMTKDVSLGNFKDEYRRALVELLEAKLEGKTIEAPKPKKQEADLADALLASLAAAETAAVAS